MILRYSHFKTVGIWVPKMGKLTKNHHPGRWTLLDCQTGHLLRNNADKISNVRMFLVFKQSHVAVQLSTDPSPILEALKLQ